jgi:mRNA interferase RelE/StbE
MFSIQWSRKALKQLLRFPLKDRRNISAAVDDLSTWPDCAECYSSEKAYLPIQVARRPLPGVFEIDKKIKLVAVEEVKKRDERTY